MWYNVDKLITKWKERIKDKGYSQQYLDGVRDCLYELTDAMSDCPINEMPLDVPDDEALEYILGLEADMQTAQGCNDVWYG